MIQKVNGVKYFGQNNSLQNKSQEKSYQKDNYTDSFVKNVKQSAPAFLGLTAMWAVLDNKMRAIPMKKSLVNNFFSFFLPVILVSSAILAGLENRTSKNNQNKSLN